MPFSAKKEITINRSTQSGVGLPSEVSVIDALFKVTAMTRGIHIIFMGMSRFLSTDWMWSC